MFTIGELGGSPIEELELSSGKSGQLSMELAVKEGSILLGFEF